MPIAASLAKWRSRTFEQLERTSPGERMKFTRPRPPYLAVLLAVTVACAGDEGPTAPSIGSVQPYTQTLGGTVDVLGLSYHTLTIPRAGQMSLLLTWTDPTIDLDLHLAPPGCTNLYPMATCGVLLSSDTAVGVIKEGFARSVSNGETFTIWIDNFSDRATTYTLNLTIE
jgi:hypothetical protein